MKKIFSLLLIVILFAGACESDDSGPTIDLTTGLKVYYPFDGDANDVSGNGNDTSTAGDILSTSDRLGNDNSAYDFDGINDVINTNNTFDFPERSLSIWISPSAIEGSNGNGNNTLTHVAITQDADDLANGILRVDIDNGNLKLWAGGISGTYLYENVSENLWYHLVLIRDTNTTKYYVNGTKVFEGTSDDGGSSFNPNRTLIIGAGRSTTNQFFEGKIDNVRIYDIVLSEEQITELYRKYL